MPISTDAMKDPAFLSYIEDVLRLHYYRRDDEDFYRSEGYAADLKQHSYERFSWAFDYVIPWLGGHFDPADKYFVEVGCGTGSSTLAFASTARLVECFEIAGPSIRVAEARLAYWGSENVLIREELFEKGTVLQEPGNVDGVILFATLEHMTLQEALDVLAFSWDTIKPGGVIVVADTPNRFSPFDHHTSHLPFFSQLPRDLQLRYAQHSPRKTFRDAITSALRHSEAKAMDTLLRLGNGISYHEFELALGDDVHKHIVMTGHELPLTKLFAITPRENLLAALFENMQLAVSPAFTRLNMNFVIQKPALS